jgi:lycopene cyclase domain-containing protein
VFVPPLLIGTFYSLADSVAVRDGIWHFDRAQILGIHVGVLPIEEILFFYITALLVSQSFVMLIPGRMRL